ncbi:MAG TPA: hypothetical protein G4O03_00880 [Dehalococcoidia bacterium]|nr:hypothetical protein [Dehalococcoidia bacterium]
MKKRLFTVVALLAAAAVSGISFAATTGTTATSITTVGPAGVFCEVKDGATSGLGPYATADEYQTTPIWHPSTNATGEIPYDGNSDGDYLDDQDNSPGDLYVVDLTTYTGDVLVTLYLNNPVDLTAAYSYLNMAICVYKATAWNDADLNNTVDPDELTWETIGSPSYGVSNGAYDTYLTLTNGYVSFVVTSPTELGTGDYRHRFFAVTLDAGIFYCIDATATLSPAFYIDVRQA